MEGMLFHYCLFHNPNFFFCPKDKRREKRTLEWWAGAVSASQDVMKCVQEQRGSNGADLCCGIAFSGKLHIFQEVCLVIRRAHACGDIYIYA